MVNLALLCNLYADGPTTLGRLRELGCEGLEDVEKLARADLEWALQAGSAACERFRREARLLRERDGATSNRAPSQPSAIAHEPERSPAGAAVSGAAPRATDRASEVGTEVGSEVAAAHGAPARPTRDGSFLGVLIQAWRRASGRASEAQGTARDPRTETAPLASPQRLDPPRDEPMRNAPARPSATEPPLPTVDLPVMPRSTPSFEPGAERATERATERTAEHGTPLERVGFQGVEADYAEQLARLGLRTVEEFLAAQPLDLAQRSTMRYTVLLRMQFLARRELERVAHG
jgi:hypothetical protein